MWAHLVAMLAFVGLMLTHVEPKDPKNGNSKKNTVKRRIFRWSAAYLGASWGYVGPSWGYVGPSWSYVGPSWGYVGPSWGYVAPSWGLCSPILRPMLAHVDPSRATRSAAGAAAPLSYGEERNAFSKDTARGPLAGFKRLRATAGQGPMLR